MKRSLLVFSLVTLTLSACGDVDSQKLQQLKQQSLQDFIFVKGGTFTMGDFGTIINGQRRYYTLIGIKGKEPHEVTLTSYSLAKNKVTWGEYDSFLLATHRPIRTISTKIDPKTKLPFIFWEEERQPYQMNETRETNTGTWPNFYYYKPASIQWQHAKDYCQWLGKELNLPIDLATEAQWEYAARSGGKEVLFSNSLVDYSKPNPGYILMDDIPKFITDFATIGYTGLQPIGTVSTPNQLGFVDMDTNGSEWVNDWYSESYYRDYPKITDPKGSATEKEKVTRVYTFTFDRAGNAPDNFFTFRCAVNSDQPIKK